MSTSSNTQQRNMPWIYRTHILIQVTVLCPQSIEQMTKEGIKLPEIQPHESHSKPSFHGTVIPAKTDRARRRTQDKKQAA